MKSTLLPILVFFVVDPSTPLGLFGTHRNADGDPSDTEFMDTCVIEKDRPFDWGYRDTKHTYSTYKWSDYYSICGNKHQSPINVVPRDSQSPDDEMPPLEITMDGEEDGLVFGYLINNGHALGVNIDESRSPVTIKGGPLDIDTYNLANFHIHFSCDDENKGSEHTINGKGYDGEIHFVFYNSKYENLKDAMPRSDGLTVIGFFISTGDTAHKGSLIMDQYIDDIEEPDRNVYMKYGFRVSDFAKHVTSFGKELPYFNYKGSLTTPPCYESVNWIVFRDPAIVNKHDLDKWRKLKSHHGKLCDNSRPVQPLNSRTVYGVNIIYPD